jgi:hypothetical protein
MEEEETTRKAETGVDSINRDLLDIGWDDMDWIGLAQDRDQWSGLE